MNYIVLGAVVMVMVVSVLAFFSDDLNSNPSRSIVRKITKSPTQLPTKEVHYEKNLIKTCSDVKNFKANLMQYASYMKIVLQ